MQTKQLFVEVSFNYKILNNIFSRLFLLFVIDYEDEYKDIFDQISRPVK